MSPGRPLLLKQAPWRSTACLIYFFLPRDLDLKFSRRSRSEIILAISITNCSARDAQLASCLIMGLSQASLGRSLSAQT
jgi:hypothetical protein